MSEVRRPLQGVTICYVSTAAFSGVTRTLKQARSMRAAGAHVVLAGFEDMLPPDIRSAGFDIVAVPRTVANVSSGRNVRALAARVFRKARAGWSRLGAQGRLAAAVVSTRADIVQSVDLPALGCATRAASQLGARLTYDSHEMWSGFLDNPEYGASLAKRWWLLGIERMCAPRADAVFVVSDEMGRRMKTRYRLQRVITVFNSPPGCRTTYVPTRSPVRLVFHGSLARTKNVESLIRAMVWLRGRASLDIHGAAYTVSSQHLQAVIRENGLEGTVRLHGPFNYEEVIPMLRAYDVEVYAAQMIEENFAISLPNKVFDAACAGLAVAASDFPAIRELLEESGCGLCIDPTSPQTIAESLYAMLHDPTQIDAMKAASVAHGPEWCWESQADKITTCFAELTRGRG